MLLVIVGAAPSLFLLLFFYLKDRYEPEPRGHVALAFLQGAVALVPAYFAGAYLERLVGRDWLLLGGTWARLFEAGVLASGIEELCKWSLFLALVYRWSEFDEPLDGVVYGVAMALGFATIENILYVRRDGLKGCYQVAERAGTVGSGKAIMSVEIQPTGQVTSVKVDAPAFDASTLPGCMTERARSWTFPKFTQGPKHFSYPFVFVGG